MDSLTVEICKHGDRDFDDEMFIKQMKCDICAA